MVINFDNTITLKYAPIEYLKLNEDRNDKLVQ